MKEALVLAAMPQGSLLRSDCSLAMKSNEGDHERKTDAFRY